MKRLVYFLMTLFTLATVASCIKLDDSQYQDELSDIKSRLSALEEKVNNNLSGLWEIVNALKSSVTVSSITESDDSWTITFSNGKTASLSKSGSAGAPEIGVKQDTDGVYYWTLGGEWLLDNGGKKLPVTGSDGAPGAPGTAPQVKIDGGYWYVSTDGGKTWSKLGKATGEDGDSFFNEVTWDDEYVYFTMADGSKFQLRRGYGLVASIAVIPDYSDGAVKAGTGLFTIRFKVEPESAAGSLLDLVVPKCFKLSAAYTGTKASAGVITTLPVHELDVKDGILTVTTDGEGLAQEFANKKLGVSAALFISDGQSLSINSGYFPLWPKNEYLGHGYVDLGLESGNKFADANVGADNPSAPGIFYAWGELQPKEDYSWSTYLWCNGSSDLITKYNEADGCRSYADCDYEDDVVRKEWGGEWRTPTKEDWEELMDNSKFTWTWTSRDGHSGYEITSKKSGYSGRSIFLPVTGVRSGLSLVSEEYGYYWSSSLSGIDRAASLRITSGGAYIEGGYRIGGYAIRPVLGKYVSKTLTGIDLDFKAITLAVGMVRHLNAGPEPESAQLPKLSWSTDDAGVATVSEDGMVAAVSAGTAHITVMTEDGAYSAICSVTVKSEAELAPEAVDLGLPSGVKWAGKNVGATVPEDYGDYFAWGETEPYYLPGHAYDNPCKDWRHGKENGYHWTAYKWNGGEANSYLKYGFDATLEPEDDAARANWGEDWRTPTRSDFEELTNREYCDWTLATINGIPGVKIISKINGNSIFLPAGSARVDFKLGSLFGSEGMYLSATAGGWWPYSLFFNATSGSTGHAFDPRECGIPVRPVKGEPVGR